MKQNLKAFAQAYGAALRTRLQPGARAARPPALALGRSAVALGLETLELARVHERALGALDLAPDNKKLLHRAEIFFAEANAPIEQKHRADQRSEVHLVRLKETLDQRTQELAATNRQLQRGVARREVMEKAFEKSGQHHKKCLEESLELQKRLRQLTHQLMAAQEAERKSISHELHDEIAQTLLGINVRLLSLKQEARVNHKGLKNDIAGTQRLVTKSAQSVRRVAREFGSL
jgi:signal transduction histidine kinase